MLLCFVSYLTMHNNSSYTVRTPTHLSVDLFKSVCGATSPITTDESHAPASLGCRSGILHTSTDHKILT